MKKKKKQDSKKVYDERRVTLCMTTEMLERIRSYVSTNEPWTQSALIRAAVDRFLAEGTK